MGAGRDGGGVRGWDGAWIGRLVVEERVIHHSLLTTHYSLPITQHSLLTTHSLVSCCALTCGGE